jgi:hypothetical protein
MNALDHMTRIATPMEKRRRAAALQIEETSRLAIHANKRGGIVHSEFPGCKRSLCPGTDDSDYFLAIGRDVESLAAPPLGADNRDQFAQSQVPHDDRLDHVFVEEQCVSILRQLQPDRSQRRLERVDKPELLVMKKSGNKMLAAAWSETLT